MPKAELREDETHLKDSQTAQRGKDSNMQDDWLFDHESWKRQHENLGNDSGLWTLTADSLLIAARYLKQIYDSGDRSKLVTSQDAPPEFYVYDPCLLLRGYAVECLLKALRLRQGHKLVKKGSFIGGFCGANNHRLDQMAKDIGKESEIKFTTDELDLLKRLSYIVRVTGRYPVAREYTDDMPVIKERDGRKLIVGPGGWEQAQGENRDEQTFDKILKKLEPHLGKKLKYRSER